MDNMSSNNNQGGFNGNMAGGSTGVKPNFCPNCGAKMIRKHEEAEHL